MNLYEKNIVEFITVAVEFCVFLEKAENKKSKDFVSVLQKLLPFFYLKASMLDKPVLLGDDDLETFVTENDYQALRIKLEKVLGANDAYFDGESASSISENIADIYQDIKDCTQNYKIGKDSVMNDAIYNCVENFENYWGAKLLSVLTAVHNIRYTDNIDEIEENYENDRV